MKEYTNSNYFFIQLIMKYKWHFIIITVGAIIIAAIFSSEFFIKPKYKSTSTLYPSNLTSYSDESPSEQMLQLLQASDVRDGVIKKFNLAEHYQIDTTQKNGKTALVGEYESNIKIKRTQYESIEIEVMDTDPVLARDMVLQIIAGVNLKARNLQREKTMEVLNMYKNQLKIKRTQVDSLFNILQELREKNNLLDYDIQAKEATKSYLKGITSGKNKESLKDASNLLKSLEQKGGLYYEASRSFDVALASYNNTKIEYDNTNKDLFKELTYTNIVVKPTIADKKSYPVRWLIVVMTVGSANAMLFLLLLFLEKRKEII